MRIDGVCCVCECVCAADSESLGISERTALPWIQIFMDGTGAEDEHRPNPKIKWKLLINYLQEINYDRLLAVKLPTHDVNTAAAFEWICTR